MSNTSPQFNGCLLVLKNMEEVLGVYNLVPSFNTTSELLPIEDYCKIVIGYLKGFKGKSKLELLSKSGYFLTTLCFIKSICSFKRISLLDFSEVPRVDALAQLLIPFLKRENITEEIEDNVNYLVQYLKVLESKNSNFLNSMSYRYLRLFITLAYARYFKLASIVADFIIDQIFIGEDLDNSVRQKLDDLIDARKYVNVIDKNYGVTKVKDEQDDSQPNESVEKEKSNRVVNLVKDTVKKVEDVVDNGLDKIDVATTRPDIPDKGDKKDLSKLVQSWNKNVETPILTNGVKHYNLNKDVPERINRFGKVKPKGDENKGNE